MVFLTFVCLFIVSISCEINVSMSKSYFLIEGAIQQPTVGKGSIIGFYTKVPNYTKLKTASKSTKYLPESSELTAAGFS